MAAFEYLKEIQKLLNTLSPEGNIQLLAWGIAAGTAYVWCKEDNDDVHVFIHNPDGLVFNKEKKCIQELFEQGQYCLAKTCMEKSEFLKNEIEMVFSKLPALPSDERQKNLLTRMQNLARENNLQFRAMLNMEGGRAWLNYSRVEENDYMVQISTGQPFDDYKKIRDGCCDIFRTFGAVLAGEHDYKSRPNGFQKELIFIDKAKYAIIQASEAQSSPVTTIGTQINSNIETVKGNVNTGSAEVIDNSSTETSSDEKWFQKEIVKMILSFIGGVAATLVAQCIMKAFG